jgi:DNA mismatch repair protein MutS2
MRAAALPLGALDEIEGHAKRLEERLDKPVEPATEVPEPIDDEDVYTFRLGETVWVRPLSAEGQITELTASEAEVQVGRLRTRVSLDDLEHRTRSERAADRVERRRDPLPARSASPGMELDLRGQVVEDALPRVDDYLDAAYMAGLPFVRIIHGKGTGVLRRAIRDVLRGHPLVSSSQKGSAKEGGDGVTVVKLVQQ